MSFALNSVGEQQLFLYELPYVVLYSRKDSRPNTPVNIPIGALIIKEYLCLSDNEILTSLMFGIRFQYALHTISYIEQLLNYRTFRRFRERCNTYEAEHGINMLHETLTSFSQEMAELMKVDFSLRRININSLIVSSEK